MNTNLFFMQKWQKIIDEDCCGAGRRCVANMNAVHMQLTPIDQPSPTTNLFYVKKYSKTLDI